MKELLTHYVIAQLPGSQSIENRIELITFVVTKKEKFRIRR